MLSHKSFPVLTSLFAVLSFGLSACVSSSANVVSSSNSGPTISQAQAQPANGPKRRIAVTNFEYKAGQGSGQIGVGMSDMLTDSLVNSNAFIVLERERLDEVMEEQDLSNSNRFAQNTAAPIGQLEGAELLIRGSIIQFEPNCKGGSVILVSGKQACIAINIRIVDARTGRVVNATTVEATSAQNRYGLVFAVGSMPFGLGTYSKTPMEQAIRNGIEAAVAHIVSSKL